MRISSLLVMNNGLTTCSYCYCKLKNNYYKLLSHYRKCPAKKAQSAAGLPSKEEPEWPPAEADECPKCYADLNYPPGKPHNCPVS